MLQNPFKAPTPKHRVLRNLALIIAASGLVVFSQHNLQAALFVATSVVILWLHHQHRWNAWNLKIREEEFRSTFEVSSVGMVRTSLENGGILLSNQSFATMVGYETSELANLTFADIMHPEDVGRNLANFKALAESKISEYRDQKRYVRKDGSVIWGEFISNLVTSPNGKPVCVSTVVQEITVRKTLEDNLRQSQMDLNRAQSVAQIGSWRIDLVRGEHSFSDEACKILGKPPGSTFSREEFISQIHAEDRAPVQRSIAASLEGEVFDIRYRILAAGRVKWVRSKAEVTFAPSGRPFEVIGTTQDVTNSVRVEKALEKAKNQAEQANHSKDLFLATLSHELRTPLNVIQLWAELMKAHKISASEMDIAIKAIDHNARTLGQIISDLLDVSRIISGKLILERENLDVNALLNEAVASARPLATLKSIEMDTDLDASLGMVLADRVRVIQIVSNLLSNATKFTPQNGRVVVRSRRAGEKCEIEVVDSGMGIAADFLPKIFDRFMQADSSRIRQQGGLGLGLAVVRDLAEMHGGSVSALSRGIGEGATFTVTLPLKQALGEPHSEAPISQPEALSTDLRGCRILFVDDSEDSREVISAALVALGAEVLTANSAQEGLRLLQEHRPDVLLSDISMPDEDGYALISKVRSIGSEVGATPAIALSANASGSDVLRSRQAGFRAHLSKPVDWNVLGHAIVKLVRDETQSES